MQRCANRRIGFFSEVAAWAEASGMTYYLEPLRHFANRFRLPTSRGVRANQNVTNWLITKCPDQWMAGAFAIYFIINRDRSETGLWHLDRHIEVLVRECPSDIVGFDILKR